MTRKDKRKLYIVSFSERTEDGRWRMHSSIIMNENDVFNIISNESKYVLHKAIEIHENSMAVEKNVEKNVENKYDRILFLKALFYSEISFEIFISYLLRSKNVLCVADK
jgi:hypothetical protein